MKRAGLLFPHPSREHARAFEEVRDYLERAATQAGSSLMVWQPDREASMLQELQQQLQQSAAVCATMLDVVDGWATPMIE